MEKYTIEKRIGTGSYGTAYLAHLKTDRDTKLVLKRIKLDNVSEKERAAAHYEVKVLSQLSHPFVLGYIDSFMHKNCVCIVTEYCEAGDLYNRLKDTKKYIKEDQVVEWFVQLMFALQYLHEQKVLHRDLKTQNIFLTKDGNIKLGDFGIARVLNADSEMAMTVIGTPYYMSPEIMESKPYDFKSDLWALGCVLYEMTSLKHAFDAQDMNGLVMKILRGKYLPTPLHYSPELRQVIHKLLSKAPEQRPTCEQLMEMVWVRETVMKFGSKVVQLRKEQMMKMAVLQAKAQGKDPKRALQKLSNERLKNAQQRAGNMDPTGMASRPPLVPSAIARSSSDPTVLGLPRQRAASIAVPSRASVPTAQSLDSFSQLHRSGAIPLKGAGGVDMDDAIGQQRLKLLQIQRERDQLRMQALKLEDEKETPRGMRGVGASAVSSGRLSGDRYRRASDHVGRSQDRAAFPEDDSLIEHLREAERRGGIPMVRQPRQKSFDTYDDRVGVSWDGPDSHLSQNVQEQLRQHRMRRRMSEQVSKSNYNPIGEEEPSSAPARPADDFGHISDPKLRMQMRKEQEILKRQEELKNARSDYYQERILADQKTKEQYVGSHPHARHPMHGNDRDSLGVAPSHKPRPRASLDTHSYQPHEQLPTYNFQQMPLSYEEDQGAFLSDGELSPERSSSPLHRSNSPDDSNALWEEDDRLNEGKDRGPLVNMATFNHGSTQDRVSAMRALCIAQLGHELYNKLYMCMRDHGTDSEDTDPEEEEAFRGKLRKLLGPKHQYVNILDRILYEEDHQGS